MLYSEIIAVCSQIHTKHINTLCGQNVECRTYRAVNTLRLRYKNQPVNAVQWNNRCLFSDPHKTHKYTVNALILHRVRTSTLQTVSQATVSFFCHSTKHDTLIAKTACILREIPWRRPFLERDDRRDCNCSMRCGSLNLLEPSRHVQGLYYPLPWQVTATQNS